MADDEISAQHAQTLENIEFLQLKLKAFLQQCCDYDLYEAAAAFMNLGAEFLWQDAEVDFNETYPILANKAQHRATNGACICLHCTMARHAAQAAYEAERKALN